MRHSRMNPLTGTAYPKASKKYIQTFVRTFSDLLGQHGAHVEPAPQSQQQFSSNLLFTITDHAGDVIGTLGLWPGGITKRLRGGRDWSFASAHVQTPDFQYPASLQLKGFTAIEEPQEPEADAKRLFQQMVSKRPLSRMNPVRSVRRNTSIPRNFSLKPWLGPARYMIRYSREDLGLWELGAALFANAGGDESKVNDYAKRFATAANMSEAGNMQGQKAIRDAAHRAAEIFDTPQVQQIWSAWVDSDEGREAMLARAEKAYHMPGRFKMNPHRAPNARSMGDLINAGVLEELGQDQAELIGRVSERAGVLQGDHVYLVLLHIPRKGWSVVALDDEGAEYVVAYAGIPDEALARTAARWEYSALNGHAVDTKQARLFKKYMQEM